jgi:hypothetical protein
MGRRKVGYQRKVAQYLNKHGVKPVGEVTARVASSGTERKVTLQTQWAKEAGAK